MTRFRIVFTLSLALLIAPAVFAAQPSARLAPRMVYDPNTTFTYLYGGLSNTDVGTAKSYDIDETWVWVGERWIQLYPAHTPGGRSYQMMVWDYAHNRAILFGGRNGVNHLNDTWAFDGKDWTQLNPPNSPPARIWGGMTYDRKRNVAVLYGGQFTTADGKTTTQLYDTWEFDGTNWTKRSTSDGPKVTTPVLAYDVANDTTYLLGSDTDGKPHFYSYNAQSAAWTELTPSTMPDCAVDGGLTYDEQNQKLVFYAGTCSTSGTTGETYEWDGTNWTKISPSATISRLNGEAISYDVARQRTMTFGGMEAFGAVQSKTFLYILGVWQPATADTQTPGPRSLFVLVTDPTSGVIWLYGGLNDEQILDDLWKYSAGHWEQVTVADTPTVCSTPNGVWDTDRSRLVIVCADSSLHEFSGAAWKNFAPADFKKKPQTRRFSSAAYDQSLKKTVLFGGYNETNYIDDTWLWDGTTWTQITKNLPYDRSHAAMWYDPTMKKTLIYGGIGQRNRDARIERFSDMWSFDGTGWTQMKSITSTPGQRYGTQVVVDPGSKNVYLFGGMKLNVNGNTQTQTYANDFWKWDGAQWTQITTSTTPPPRENSALAFDPLTNDMITFGGWAGFYRSDLWLFRGNDWTLANEAVPPPPSPGVVPPADFARRRSARH
jgi:hypothetical protein